MTKIKDFSFKAVAVIVAISVLFSVLTVGFAFTAQSDSADNFWSGNVAEYYAGGSGTKAEPYLISNGEELAKLVKDAYTADKYYKLTDDIMLNDTSSVNWKNNAKGWYGYNAAAEFPGKFSGTLDGNGHKISGFYYNGSDFYFGLFASLGEATIKNLIVTDSYIATSSASGNISVFTGHINGNVNYSSCIVTETVSISGVEASCFGSWNKGNITVDSCAALANVTGTLHAGAFFADVWQSELVIKNSFGIGNFSPRRGITSVNNYGTVADAYGTNVITADEMKGEQAKTNMPKLDWEKWQVTEGYPTIKIKTPQPTNFKVWTGATDSAYAGGEGTQEEPYLISCGEQLAKLVKDTDTSGKYYKLTEDIYLNDINEDFVNEWFTYQTSGKNYFQGNFDGNGKTIYGIYYNNTSSWCGLFPAVKGNVEIKNLTISNSSITSSQPAGVLITGGIAVTSIKNCHITESVTLKGGEGVGALVAYNGANINVDTCSVTASISGTKYVGAFFGDLWTGTITVNNSFSSGKPISGRRSFTSEKGNNYSTEADSNGTNVVAANKMQGEQAKTNMPKLDWSKWKVSDGYPVYGESNPNGTKGEVWSGNIAESYAGGTGTEGDPYLIETPEQLARMVGYDVLTNYSGNISNGSANKYYKLTADIYLNDVSESNWYQKSGLNKWYSSNASRFCGNFDGDGYVIYGLYSDSSSAYNGLFPVADAWTQDRYFKNITVSHSYLVSSNTSAFVGGIIGRIYSNNNKFVYFNNCYVTDSVIFSSTSNSTYWGGLVGYAQPNSNSFYSFTGCASLAKTPTKCGLTGSDNPSGTVSISNCFALADKWYSGSNNTLADSYLISDLSAIYGTDAKIAMSGLAWDYIWKTVDDGYPTYYSREYDLNGTVGEVWSGLTAIDYAGGSGTVNDPYKIATAEQFVKMLKDTECQNKYYELVADIRFNDTSVENWTENAKVRPCITNRFKGNFDGKGHTVSGVYYNGTENNIGLFCVAQDAVIKNLVFDNSYLKSGGYAVGGIVGQAIGKVEFNECYIGKNVYVESEYYVDKSNGGDMGAGGIVGYGGAEIKINGCAFFGTVAAEKNVGSIAGNCWNKVTVTNTVSDKDMRFCSKMTLDSASDNNYSAYTGKENNVIYVSTVKMIGEDAMENMSGLDWGRIWKTTENSYPVCQFTEDAGSPEGIWSGNIATEYAGGTGTDEDPYLISNGEQLALMVTDTDNEGKYYKLTKDIKLNDTSVEKWRYVARQWLWTANVFKGNFDGDGNKITGLYYNGTKAKVGLFNYTADVQISNVIVDESYLHSTGYGVGAIIGDANSGTALLTECYVGENVNIESTYDAGGDAGAGGIIGYGGAIITVDSCGFFGSVKAPQNTGAIIGNCWAKNEVGSSANVIVNSVSSSKESFCSKQALNYISNNNYSAGDNGEYGVVCIAETEMKGKTVTSAMSKLDWGRHWRASESGYPTLRFGDVEPTEDGFWSGEIATEYAGGTGTKEDPYLISNGEQLARMVTDADNEGKYYKLTKDIKLNDTSKENWKITAKNWVWTDIVFKGNLNGDNHSVTGLYFNTTMYKVGLFCYSANSSISNIIIDNSYIHSTSYATGSLIGDANSGKINVESCYVGEDVYVESAFDADQNVGAGGIIGYGGAELEICGCAFLGTVKAPSNVGAILGNCWGKNVEGTSGLTVKNTYSNSEHKFCSKQSLGGTSADNYSAGTMEEVSVRNISAESMVGSKAKKSMSALNWFRYWKTTKGYPMINGGTYEGKEGEVWSGRIAENFAGGTGTKDDPYLIATGEQLAKLLDNVLDSKGKYYKLTSDIYLNDVNNPNWENENPRSWYYVTTARYGNFNGHFNGDGHVIHGLYLNMKQNASVVYTGLFPTVSDGTVIEKTGISNSHIKITNNNVDWQSYVGGFTGLVFFNQADELTDVNNLTVFSQCFGDSKVVLEGRYVGGIVSGGPRPANINNCYFIGKVIGERVGAIIGNTWNDFVGATVTQNYGATIAEDIFCGGRAGVQNSATSYKYYDNYTNATGSVSGHATQISLLMMRGDSAKKNMPALDFENIWHALPNGTPVLKIFGTTDKYSNTADPEPIQISFVSNGGSECDSIYGNPEEKLTLPTPTKTGYKFGGWYVYRELDIPFSIDYFPYFDQMLYAKWIPLGIIEDFESYSNSVYDLGYDYEYYRPGTVGYDATYVKSGMAAIHRIGAESDSSDFLINYEDMLTVGKKYNMSFWVTTDKVDTSVKLSLVHEDWPDVFDSDSGVEKITELKQMKVGEWIKVEFTFIAQTKWVAIRSSGNASVFFEDVMILQDSDKIYPVGNVESDEETNEELPVTEDNQFGDSFQDDSSFADDFTDSDTSFEDVPEEQQNESNKVIKKRIWRKKKPGKGNDNLIWIISGISAAVLLLAGATVTTIIIIKKRKVKK